MTFKQFRKSHNWTQAQFAIKAGVSITTYRTWETGLGRPNEESMQKLISIGAGECVGDD